MLSLFLTVGILECTNLSQAAWVSVILRSERHTARWHPDVLWGEPGCMARCGASSPGVDATMASNETTAFNNFIFYIGGKKSESVHLIRSNPSSPNSASITIIFGLSNLIFYITYEVNDFMSFISQNWFSQQKTDWSSFWSESGEKWIIN